MIANVREHRSIKRDPRFCRRNRQTRERHQRKQAGSFQHDGFATRISAGNHHRGVLVVEFE